MTREELSKELVKLREKAGFKSANSISKEIGTSQSYASNWETGKRNFKLDFLFKYLKVVRMHLFLVSKDGDEKKNKLIKQPGVLGQYIVQMLRLQHTNPKNIIHNGVRNYIVHKIVDGDLSVGVDGFLQFLDVLGYDVCFQANEVMAGRVEAAKKAEEDRYKPLSDDEVKKERLRIGEVVRNVRILSKKRSKDIICESGQSMQLFRELEVGERNYMIKTLFNYIMVFNTNMYAASADEKIMMNMENIGKFIKNKKECIGHSTVLLTSRLNISDDTITKIENGSNFTINNCIQLLNYFGYKITIE
jgi:transcriptional regulator with XRE-family HTH domain